MKNRIIELLGIKYPIIQGGMVWVSGWKLASAVSNAGGLGVIGAGSMSGELLTEHIKACKEATDKPFGVNIPLMLGYSERAIAAVVEQGVKVVITSAGNPATYTSYLQSKGIKVMHVVSSEKFALKAEQAGVDAVIAEGVEAGGHNGKEETTTMVLVPTLAKALKVPVVAAGGIATGEAMFAAFALGASGVQLGTRFAATTESSAHELFKEAIIRATDGQTALTLKEITPTRLLKNDFYYQVEQLYASEHYSIEALQALLGRGRAKRGIFEGDLNQGEIEIGQVSSMIDKISTAKEVITELITGFKAAQVQSSQWNF